MANDMTPSRLQASFDLAGYFEGQTRAWGIFEDRFCRLKRRFSVDIEGSWRDGALELVEKFTYDDGEREQRIWRITRGDAGTFTATSSECVGTALGRTVGDIATMTYAFNLKLKSRRLAVTFSDVFYRMDQTRLFNRAVVSKWGITLGVATIFFEKPAVRLASSGVRATG